MDHNHIHCPLWLTYYAAYDCTYLSFGENQDCRRMFRSTKKYFKSELEILSQHLGKNKFQAQDYETSENINHGKWHYQAHTNALGPKELQVVN